MATITLADTSSRPHATSPDPVFDARGVTKVYHMGEVDVHALRGVDLELHESELAVLLGPSGSGKSTVAAELAALGAKVLDADSAARQAINLPEVKRQLVERWGEAMLDNSGEVNRHFVAEQVFGETASARVELEFLESLLHPLIRRRAGVIANGTR